MYCIIVTKYHIMVTKVMFTKVLHREVTEIL